MDENKQAFFISHPGADSEHVMVIICAGIGLFHLPPF